MKRYAFIKQGSVTTLAESSGGEFIRYADATQLEVENQALRAAIQRYLESEVTLGCNCVPGHRAEPDGRWIDAYQCIPCQMREALAMND